VFLVSGTCQAVDIKLDSTSVPFGAVVMGSQSSRVMVMHNLGDIGARFSWNMNEFSSDFSVEPTKGYSSPGTEVSFELKFCPQNVNQDIRSEVRWRIRIAYAKCTCYMLSLCFTLVKKTVDICGNSDFSFLPKILQFLNFA
jgi:hypothetical protein